MAKVYACYNKHEEIRKKSSSGGIFYLVAKSVIEKKGVVFGAKFNEFWEVEHGYTETLEGISEFMGSKYVQSSISGMYIMVKKFLDEGRLVLFSGTPCQIAGLLSFLGKEYENLITVDFICHGVPSRMVWREYLKQIADYKKIKEINFREKSKGWLDFSLKIDSYGRKYHIVYYEDAYLRGFLQDFFLRPSCYECQFKGLQRKADITLADFWGVQKILPDYFDNRGTSIVLVHSKKGQHFFEQLHSEILCSEMTEEIVLATNPAVVKSAVIDERRAKFMRECKDDVYLTLRRYTKISLTKKLIKRMIRKIRVKLKK